MVSQWEKIPGDIPVKTLRGWVLLTELGTYKAATQENGVEEDE